MTLTFISFCCHHLRPQRDRGHAAANTFRGAFAMIAKFPRIFRVAILPLFLAAPLLALSGCLVANSSTERRTGDYISNNTWSQIEPGKTSKEWVRSVVGEPTTTTRLTDGTEIWKYSYSIHSDKSNGVFLIYGSDEKTIIDGNAFVEFKDNVVSKNWRDDQVK
jgi:outer membrane protein assembly factor BamE (lipoprotein component of BamABCDE complex)